MIGTTLGLDLYVEDLSVEELPAANQAFCSSANLSSLSSFSTGITSSCGSTLSSGSSLSSAC